MKFWSFFLEKHEKYVELRIAWLLFFKEFYKAINQFRSKSGKLKPQVVIGLGLLIKRDNYEFDEQ